MLELIIPGERGEASEFTPAYPSDLMFCALVQGSADATTPAIWQNQERSRPPGYSPSDLRVRIHTIKEKPHWRMLVEHSISAT